MIVAGVMSGTSGDGIDVALVRLSGAGFNLKLKLRAHRHTPYPSAVRKKVLSLMNASAASVADLSRLNFLLGELYAEAIAKTIRQSRLKKVDLIGCHGQTLYHQSQPAKFLGRSIAATWQSGEAAVIAARLQTPVVSDFRPADLAVGGCGAPLVPYLDYLLFRHPRRGRILLNLGGIANLTAIPAGASPRDVIAFDTGPGNMVIDALARSLCGRPLDGSGDMAARGTPRFEIVKKCLRAPFFQLPPPRTAGREQFGEQFTEHFIHYFKRASRHKENVLATATALTAASIADALCRFVLPATKSRRNPQPFHDLIVSGGGTKNRTLMRMIGEVATPLNLSLRITDDFGLPSQAKEAVAFALLAYQTWNRQPGNLPAATGAQRPAILGKVSFP